MNEAIWFLREIKNELIFCGHNTFSSSHKRRPMMEDSYSGKYYSSDAQKNGNKVGDKVPANVNQGEDIPERETWNNKIDFLLACIGFSVGLGNVWRFPYLCYKNGGGAFLIPYLLCVVVGGIPLFYLEVALGQFMSSGGISAWRICPIFQGIGWSTTAIVFYLNCYYNVILAWAFFYFFASLTSKLPWESCDYDDWASENCTENFDKTLNSSHLVDPTTDYWERKVLGISDGIDDMGTVKWDITLCLLLAWIVVYACIIKGVKSSGKVMYITATSPYIFMLILCIRSAFLDGARDGVEFYVKPDMNKLGEIDVWVDAGTQIFFSYSISLGALTALGSYNKFTHNSYKDAIIFACTNSGTSIFAGFVIFSVLGFMANEQGVDVGAVAAKGPGLAFVAYPKAVAQMPIAPLWSCIFFIMVILLGLDSQFVGVEGLVTSFVDAFPSLRKGYRREIFTGFACLVQFLVGLAMVTNGGMYVFQLFDYYAGSKIVLFVAFFMCIAVAYIYGVNRFYDNIEMMLGYRINPYMKICWLFCAPVFCIVVFILSIVTYSELEYERSNNTIYKFPDWAVAVGWSLAASTAIWIPITAVFKIIQYRGQGRPLMDLFKPEGLKPHQLREVDLIDSYALQQQDQEKGTFDNKGFSASQ